MHIPQSEVILRHEGAELARVTLPPRKTVNGKAYRDLPAPLHEIGAMLEARAIHTGRSAYNHLLAMAQTHGLPRAGSTR